MTEPPTLRVLSPSSTFDLLVWCVGPLGTAMRVRVLHAKLYAYALPGSTARQLFNSSTLPSTARQLDSSTDLDRPRQTSTELDAQAHGVRLDRLDKNSTGSTGKASTAPRQRLDSASTAPRRSLDSSTARQPGLKSAWFSPGGPRPACTPAWRGKPASSYLTLYAANCMRNARNYTTPDADHPVDLYLCISRLDDSNKAEIP